MRLARHISGERVFEALQAHPDGLPKPALASLTNLSTNQVGIGITWIRDVAAGEHTTPITWTREHGYQLSPDTDILRTYEHAQIRTKLVGLTRLMSGTIAPHTALAPDDEWVQKAAHMVTATCDMLETLTTTQQARV